MKQNKSPFKWCHFEPTIILLCVRCYCRYQLSYRDIPQADALRYSVTFCTLRNG